MSTKYVTGCRYIESTPLIKVIDVERETEKCIWIRNGRREAKQSEWQMVWDTWEEAHAYLLKRAEEKVQGVRRQLELANSFLGNVKGLKKSVAA